MKNTTNKIRKQYPVCHLVYQDFPLDPRVRRYIRALNGFGINCIIVCPKRKKNKFIEKWEGNLIYRVPVAKHRINFFFTGVEYVLFTVFSTFYLIYLGLKYKFKIIHTHTLPDFLIYAGIFNKIFGSKLILDFHEIFPEFFSAIKPHLKNSIYTKILKFIETISIKISDQIITIHEPAKEIFVSRHRGIENKIHVIMNGVETYTIPDVKRLLTDKYIIVFNGTVVEILNLKLILQAIKHLENKIPSNEYDKIVFEIYGDGPALKGIFELAEKLEIRHKIYHEDFIKQEEMFQKVLKANVCIIPPEKNIYSDLFYTTKLVEMVYLKIPVIATRLKTYKYYYSEDSIFYFDSGNVEQLADILLKVFYNRELVEYKVQNAFRDYQKVSWDIMSERYITLIKQILLENN